MSYVSHDTSYSSITNKALVFPPGLYGLSMAKAYIQVNPDHKVVVYTDGSSIGGVWAKERLYPNLKTNNMLGTFELSDLPMATETYGVKPGEHIPGDVMHRYLEDYATKFDVTRHIRFNSKVEEVEENENDSSWTLTICSTSASSIGKRSQIKTKRLVVATGMASEASIPSLPGSESFKKPLFHFSNFNKHLDTVSTSKAVAILGSAKAAWDVCYDYASAGVQVEWIIRRSGLGPNWMAPPYVTPLRRWLEKLVMTRFLTWFSPCIWGDADGYATPRSWLHSTVIGRWIVDNVWAVLSNDVIQLNRYDRSEETKKLKPRTTAFWVGSMLSILNYETDFFELVKNGRIRVHLADVERLSPGAVHLDDGKELKVDLLCCATGWKHDLDIKFRPTGVKEKVGLPTSSPERDAITTKADTEILQRFPKLQSQPDLIRFPEDNNAKSPNRSWRLFRLVIPPAYLTKRNIGFCGITTPLNTTMCAQTQALWLTAYLSGLMDISQFGSAEDVVYTTELENRWGRWRYPQGFAARFPDFVFDSLPYIDLLLGDLGLNKWRKGGMLSEIFEPYGVEDYRGLVEEWMEAHRHDIACDFRGDIASESSELRKRMKGVVKN